MKRIICFLIAFICLPLFASAEYDFSSMTDSELVELISNAQEELKNRSEGAKKEIVLYDDDGIKVYLTRNYKIRDLITKEKVIDIECIIENTSSRSVVLYVPNSSMNDWESGSAPCYGDSSFDFEVSPNKKAKGVICFSLKEANVKEYSEIEKIDFLLGLYFNGRSYISNPPNSSKKICLEFIDGVIVLSE